jgi:integrase
MKEQMLIFDSNHNKTEDYYTKLSKTERKILDEFENYCLISADVGRAKKNKSNVVRFLIMANKKLGSINLQDLRDFLRILKQSELSDYYKNDVKAFVQRFLKWYFKDWSERFNNFEDVRFNSDAQRSKKIDPKDVLSLEDITRLIKKETSLFWKTFIIVQFEGALRTLECRKLKWSDIDTNDSEAYFLNVSSKKNRNGTEKERTSAPLAQAIYYLDELKKEQKGESVFVFPSRISPNDYISSGSVGKWFNRLTKKVLGKSIKSYILRHSRGEGFHKLVRDGKLSKENALIMMGHSEKMFDKTYSHADKQEIKKILKKQVLDVDYIEPEKKHDLEIKIDELNDKISKIEPMLDIVFNLNSLTDKELERKYGKEKIIKFVEDFKGIVSNVRKVK